MFTFKGVYSQLIKVCVVIPPEKSGRPSVCLSPAHMGTTLDLLPGPAF